MFSNIFVSAGNPDILICGNCRELFNDIVDLLEHKKIYCKMRFTCKCDQNQHADTDAASKCCHKEPETASPTNKKGEIFTINCYVFRTILLERKTSLEIMLLIIIVERLLPVFCVLCEFLFLHNLFPNTLGSTGCFPPRTNKSYQQNYWVYRQKNLNI